MYAGTLYKYFINIDSRKPLFKSVIRDKLVLEQIP